MAAYSRTDLVAMARQIATQYGVDPDIFVRQIQQESGFDPTAHNPSGATGIAQLMPAYYPNAGDDPIADLTSAAQTMAGNLKRYNGDYQKALAAYNAGAGNVDKYGGVPPFAETQAYVKAILGTGGGRTMSTKQDAQSGSGGLSPEQLAAIISQAGGYNGVTQGSMQVPSTDPTLSGYRVADTSVPTITYRLNNGKVLVVSFDPTAGSVAAGSPGDQTYDASGNPTDKGTSGQWVVQKGTTAFTTSASLSGPKATSGTNTKDQYILITDPKTGQVTSIPNPNYVAPIAPLPKTTVSGASASDQYILQTDPTTGQITKIPNPNYVSPKGQLVQQADGSVSIFDPSTGELKQLQAPDPNEAALKQAQTAETLANAQKIQQGLRPLAQSAIEDASATIAAIQQKIADGSMSPQDANALMQQVHDGLKATLAGTTLFEQQKQAQDTQTQRASTATSFLNNRAQESASLGAQLFNAAISGKIMLPHGQKSFGIDPLAIANQEVDQQGGGQATGDAMRQFLQSVFGGANTNGQGANTVQPGQQASQYPTTREAVLAMYPHLGQPAAAPVAAAAQPAAAPTPMPLSPQNQLIQAGG